MRRVLLCLVLLTLAVVLPTPPKASAAEPQINITLSQTTAESEINKPFDFTATVTTTVNSKTVPAEGWAVAFSGSGDGGWTSPIIYTSGGGDAVYTRVTQTPGSETITAEIVSAGCSGIVSNSVTHDWFEFQIGVNRNRRPAQARNHLLASKRQTSTVQKARRLPPRTAAVGNPPPFTIELTPSAPDARVGTPMTWKASVTIPNGGDTVPVDGIDVTFKVANTRWPDTTVATHDGVATFTPPASNTALTDTVTATLGLDGCGSLTSTAKTFEWWRPVITLSSLDASTEVGGTFELHADVTHSGGKPVASGRLQAIQESTCDPDLDNNDPVGAIADIVDGKAVFRFSRDVPTTDTYTVSELVDLDPAHAETSHRWTAPADPPIHVDLKQDTLDGRIGTDATFTATVTVGSSGGEGSPSPENPSGRKVTFSGVDVDPTDRTTDAQGQASYTYQRSSATTDHVVASTPWGCDTIRSKTVDHEWWIPKLTISPEDTTTPAGTDVEFTATLKHGDTGVPGQDLEFIDGSTSCTLPVQHKLGRTLDDGTATVPFRRDVPSIDTITVREVGNVLEPQATSTGHTWGVPDPLPFSIDLSQSSENSRVGTVLTVTAHVLVDNGDGGTAPDVGVPVRLLGATGVIINPVFTDHQGVAVFHYPRASVGQDHLSATIPYGCDVVTSNRLTHEWWVPDLTLSPLDASSTVGRLARVTATLRHDGHRIPGRVHLTIRHSLAGQKVLTATTVHHAGQVDRRWTRSVDGVDTIIAIERARVLPARATTSHTWVTQPTKKVLTLAATPDGTSGRVRSDFTVTARTRFGGAAQVGVKIHYDASMLDQPTIVAADTTGQTGTSLFTHARPVTGIERIVVTATFRGQTATQTLTRTWTENPTKPKKPVIRLVLGPDGTSSPVGSTFTPTATVTRNGKPVKGVPVTFTSRMAGAPDVAAAKPTRPDGTATFPYSRQQAGTDTIVATAEVDRVKVTRRIAHEWTQGQPPPTPPVLHAGSGTGRPGGDLPVSGEGCHPNGRVTIFVDDISVATTTADAAGRYQLRVALPDLPLGPHVVRASCGSANSTATVDLSAAQSGGGAAAAGVTTASVLCFFVLIGNALLRELNPGSIRTR